MAVKVKSVEYDVHHPSNWSAYDMDYRTIDDVEIFHTYHTFATAVVLITYKDTCELTTRQMDGIARRIDPRFRLSGSGISTDMLSQKSKFRRYTFPQ